MKCVITNTPIERLKCDVLLVPCELSTISRGGVHKHALAHQLHNLDGKYNGLLTANLQLQPCPLPVEFAQRIVLPKDSAIKSVVLFAVDANNRQQIFASLNKAIELCPRAQSNRVCLLPLNEVRSGFKYTHLAAEFIYASARYCYKFSLADEPSREGFSQLMVWNKNLQDKKLKDVVNCAVSVGDGIVWARHLAELPPNYCDPAFMVKVANLFAKRTSLKVKILDNQQLKRHKMGALLAVAQGSNKGGRLIIFEHGKIAASKGKASPEVDIALIGKGVTFDTGGISLKPGAQMDEMKFDMCGAASVFGTMLMCSLAKLPLRVLGVTPICENMPDGNAVRPGDIITSHSGKSIEVLNTDAEGRLILADALSYVQKHYKPQQMIDIATLTGACIIALGYVPSGVLANDDGLAQKLQKLGQECNDLCWQLPLWQNYSDEMKSVYADIANIGGGRGAGTITAAAFLKRFVNNDIPWAHLDIAGTGWNKQKRATGRPVVLLSSYLAYLAGCGAYQI